MAWNETVTQFTIGTSNHADNFNDVHNKLLENDKFLKESVASEATSREEADVALGEQISISLARIGDLAALPTTSKSDLVSAIKEEYNRMNVLKARYKEIPEDNTGTESVYKIASIPIMDRGLTIRQYGGNNWSGDSSGVVTIMFNSRNATYSKCDISYTGDIGQCEYYVETTSTERILYLLRPKWSRNTVLELKSSFKNTKWNDIEKVSNVPSTAIKITPKQLATTDKVDILFDVASGLSVTGNIYRINNYYEFNLTVENIDGSNFNTSNHFKVCTIPINAGANRTLSAVGVVDGWRNGVCGSFVSSVDVFASSHQAGTNAIFIGGGFTL